jgi:phosphate transport system substrate-binding protein
MAVGGEKGAVQNPFLRYAEEVGWTYLSPEQALDLRRGITIPVLDSVLVRQLPLEPGRRTGERPYRVGNRGNQRGRARAGYGMAVALRIRTESLSFLFRLGNGRGIGRSGQPLNSGKVSCAAVFRAAGAVSNGDAGCLRRSGGAEADLDRLQHHRPARRGARAAFRGAATRVEVDVQSSGSSRGIHDAREGLADLGMVSRALTADEADLDAYTIAIDGVALITHRSNPVAAQNREQIIGIYTDRINRWSEIGGPDRPITDVNKAEGRSTLELFLAHFGLRNSEVKPDVVIGDNAQGLKTVAGNPWSIGYVSIGSAEYEATHGGPIRLMPLDGVEASMATVRNGTYPLTRRLNLVARGRARELALTFIEFARSEAARDRGATVLRPSRSARRCPSPSMPGQSMASPSMPGLCPTCRAKVITS